MTQNRMHFSEVVHGEADMDVTAGRYFPAAVVSKLTPGVDHLAPLCQAILKLGWKVDAVLDPYMYRGRKTATTEYSRGKAYLLLTVYRKGTAAWAYIRVRGVGSDVLELRDWMQGYESEYGRLDE